MGGGDLNTKKSWHPSNLKNQERVWKAEKAAENEKKRISELQKEIGSERDREELKALGQRHGTIEKDSNSKLDWMYSQPNRVGNEEDYLLGKEISKNYERLLAEEKQAEIKSQLAPINHVEHECIPFSIRNFRGQSSVPPKEAQVDMARKLQEDPLMAIRKQELESRAKLLQNPVKLQQLKKMLQEDESIKKEKAKKKKKASSDLDKLLASKLSQLDDGGKVDIMSLLKKKSKSKKKKKKKSQDNSSSDSEKYSDSRGRTYHDSDRSNHDKSKRKERKYDQGNRRKRGSSASSEDNAMKRKDLSGKRNRSKDSGSCENDDRSSKRKRDDSQSSSKNKRSRREDRDIHETKKQDRSHSTSSPKHRERTISDSGRKNETKNDYKNVKKSHTSRDDSKSSRRSTSKEKTSTYSKKDDNSDSNTRDKSHDRRNYGLISSDGRKLDIKHSSPKTRKKSPTRDPKTKKEEFKKPVTKRLTEEEKEKLRREMMNNAIVRDNERKTNVERFKAIDKHEEAKNKQLDFDKQFVSNQLRKSTEVGTVEGRIKSNIYNVQRGRSDMDVNFARR